MRIVLFFLLLSASVTSLAQSIPSFSCSMQAETPYIRVGGTSELLGEIVMECTGEKSGTFEFSFFLDLNSDVAARTPSGGLTDAYVLVGDPATPVLGQNAFSGARTAPRRLQFYASATVPGSGSLRFRFVNLRASAPEFYGNTGIASAWMQAYVSVIHGVPNSNPQVAVGYAMTGGRFSLHNQNGGSIFGLSFPAAGTSTYRLRFQELFPSAFKRRNVATSLATPLAIASQASYGQDYGTESGFYLPSIDRPDGGLATQGTRLMARLTNLPPGATVRVDTVAASGTITARLIATDKYGVGDYSAVVAEADGKATLTALNGEVRAVWEVLDSVASNIETVDIEATITVSAATTQAVGVSGQLGPLSPLSLPGFRTGYGISNMPGLVNDVLVPKSLAFSHTIGAPAPAPIAIPVTSNGQSMTFTTAALTGGVTTETDAMTSLNWLNISAVTGTTPATLSAAVNPAGLSPGTYKGTIVVTSAQNTETIFVVLRVRPAAGSPFFNSCAMSASVPPVVRSNGLTEPLSDLLINCPAPPAPLITDLVLASSVPLTSRTNTIAVLVNEPTAAEQSVGTNVFYGVQDGTQIRVPGILIPTGPRSVISLRVVNLRTNAARIGLTGSPGNPYYASMIARLSNLSLTGALQTVGVVQNELDFRLLSGQQAASGITGPGTWQLEFTEGFAPSFRARNSGTSPSDPNRVVPQNVPGSIYNTETQFYSPQIAPGGLATQGTRLHVKFTGIPAGATITVPTSESATAPTAAKTQLVQADSSGAGAFVAAAGATATLTPVNGIATATWEVLSANPLLSETIQYPIQVAYGSGTVGTIGATGHLAPLSTVETEDDGAPLPRFALTSSHAPVCETLPCLRLPSSITLSSSGTAPVTATVPIDSDANPTPWIARSVSPWLRVQSAGGVTPGNLTVIADPTGLAPGSYQGGINMGDKGFWVFFNVGGNGGSPGVRILDQGIRFNYAAGSMPASQSVRLMISPGFLPQASSNVPWLQAVINFGELTLSITGNQLPSGEYDGIVTVSGAGATSQFLRVHATVGESSNTATLSGKVRNMRPGVTVQLRFPATTLNATPEPDGTYQFFSLPSAGPLYLQPLGPAGFTFVPDSRYYFNLPSTESGDFTATGPVAVSSVSPVAGQSAAQTFQFQFTDSTGWQNLDVVNVLINSYLDGRNACYIAYSRASNVLYLVPDAGGGLLPGLVLKGSGSTANKQCSISGSGSSAVGNGTTLSLNLNITFSTTSFSGNKVIYMAARNANDNTGWETRGTWRVPGGTVQFPAASGVTPSSGAGSISPFTFVFDDATAGTNLQTMWGLINTAIDGRQACYFAYYRPGNQLYLYPDNGDGNQATSIQLTGSNSISNSQCIISAAGSSAMVSGGRVTLTLPISFRPGFTGPKGIWSAVQTLNAAQTSPWEAVGNWITP